MLFSDPPSAWVCSSSIFQFLLEFIRLLPSVMLLVPQTCAGLHHHYSSLHHSLLSCIFPHPSLFWETSSALCRVFRGHAPIFLRDDLWWTWHFSPFWKYPMSIVKGCHSPGSTFIRLTAWMNKRGKLVCLLPFWLLLKLTPWGEVKATLPQGRSLCS